ncbi:MAG: hypothetical protein C4324_02715 [Blastocatellia bacterium]
MIGRTEVRFLRCLSLQSFLGMTSERSPAINFEYVADLAGLRRACEELKKEPYLGFDTETTELDPYRGNLRLVQLSSGRKTYVFDLQRSNDMRRSLDLEPLRSLLSDKSIVKIAHNAKFDLKWIKHHLGCDVRGIFDTFLASQLIAAGESERRHSLADVAQFFTGVELDKAEQISDWTAAELSPSQIEYAARDAQIMPALREQVAERLRNDALEETAEIEFDCLMPLAQLELNGVFLDRDRWIAQAAKAEHEEKAIADELQEILSAGVAQTSLFGRTEINLDSPQQVADALRNLQIPMPDSTRVWELQPLAEKYTAVAKLLEYRAARKAHTAFGENWLEFIEPTTGRIHADFRQIGAPTGRFSCSNPNLQQIPADDSYRRCFRAPIGKRLVIADYSQIELRILAEFSGDENFINAFEMGADFHRMTASQVFGVAPETVTPGQRTFAKRLNFGIVYGVGASRFGAMTGLSRSEAENMMRRYFATFRQLDSYLREVGQRVISERSARTRAGRLLRLRFDENNRESVAAARRYGVNMMIQGTSADILKRAMCLLHNSLDENTARIVNIVHDEIIVECDAEEAERVAAMVEKSMLDAGSRYLSRTPIKIEARISDEWSKG